MGTGGSMTSEMVRRVTVKREGFFCTFGGMQGVSSNALLDVFTGRYM